MKSTITVRIDEELEELLDQASKQAKRPRSELVRDALRRQLSIERFRQLRNRMIPYAEAKGILTDEDVWDEVS